MGKREKKAAKPVESVKPAIHFGNPPAKRPMLLAFSAILFAAWFAFLLVTAVFG